MAEAQLETLTEARPGNASPKPGARVRYNKIMRLLRRVHLYSGLFMTPWVFLYGITALLFNHPDSFPDQEIRRFDAAALEGTPLADLPKPEALATRVIAFMNAPGPDGTTGPAYRLSSPGEARYSRELVATVKGGGREHSVRLDLESGEGSVRSTTRREPTEAAPAPAPFARRGGVEVGPPLLASITGSLPKFLGQLGLAGEEVEVRLVPDVVFPVEGGGKTWNVSYNPRTGSISGRPADGPAAGRELSNRRFLTRLHTAHGYPSAFNARWAWAVAVDLMFVSMVGWGVTGLLMWWQMKNVRKVGAATLVVSAVVATVVAFGMHTMMTSEIPAEGGVRGGLNAGNGRGGVESHEAGGPAPAARKEGADAARNEGDQTRRRGRDSTRDDAPRANEKARGRTRTGPGL